jgi:hypothetical protein
MSQTVNRLRERMPVLFWGAVANLGFASVLSGLSIVDQGHTILGISRWAKPSKFALSISIFLMTMAWILGNLPVGLAALRKVCWGLLVCMFAEIICIAGQSARGVPSHFNTGTPLDFAVYAIMGLAIVINTVIVAWAATYFFRKGISISGPRLLGIRLGLILFLTGSAEGGVMVALARHTIGMPDGSPGIPLLNWSSHSGDLRVAHFLGLHALQIIPAAGIFFEKRRVASFRGHPELAVWLVASLYAGITALTFLQAIRGIPSFR